MKKIGIVGGLGPESTVSYYKGIHKAFKNSYEKTGFPEIFIDSLNLKEFITLEEKGKWDKIERLIIKSVNGLEKAGADFGAIASNTPHYVFNEVSSKTKLPLISIVQSTLTYAKEKGFKKLGLMGTLFTMEANFYQDAFAKEGIKLYTPDKKERRYIQKKLFSEIEFGVIKKETKEKFVNIIKKMKNRHNIQGVILGCTELPLVIKKKDAGLPLLDIVEIHIKSIVEYCKS
jgi:aspartate racemase